MCHKNKQWADVAGRGVRQKERREKTRERGRQREQLMAAGKGLGDRGAERQPVQLESGEQLCDGWLERWAGLGSLDKDVIFILEIMGMF